MGRDFFEPPIELPVVLISSDTAAFAQNEVIGCEGCTGDADIPFDWMLDLITGLDPCTTDYLLEAPVRCPYCRWEITEKTLIEPGVD